MSKHELTFKLTVTTMMNDWEWEKDYQNELTAKIERIYDLIEEINGDCEFSFFVDYERESEVRW